MKRLFLMLILFAASSGSSLLSAQESSSNRDRPTGATITAESKSYVVEGVGVAALFGAALFGVCRSSRRGT